MNVFKQMQKQQKVGLSLVMVILFIDTLLYSLTIPITPYIKETLHPSSIMIRFIYISYSTAVTWSAALALLADLFAAKERGLVMGIALSPEHCLERQLAVGC